MSIAKGLKKSAKSITAAMASEQGPFLSRVAAELSRARSKHAGINSAHEGYAVILEELDEFKRQVWLKREQRDPQEMLSELIQIAAMAARTAEDLSLISAV